MICQCGKPISDKRAKLCRNCYSEKRKPKGDVKQAKELGYKGHGYYRLTSCIVCGLEKWARLKEADNYRCSKCASSVKMNNHKLPREYKMASEVGLNPLKDYVMYKDECSVCGAELWHKRRDIGRNCKSCNAKMLGHKSSKQRANLSTRWNGGRRTTKDGYVLITIDGTSPYVSMARKYPSANSWAIREHRLVMAQHVGRLLKPHEIVHHINGDKSDNRIENLELLPHQSAHVGTILLQTENNKLRAELADAQKLIESLKAQLAPP